MSAWRRRAAVLLPDHRRLVDCAESPTALWQHLYTIATSACSPQVVNADLLRRIFQYAETCRGFGNEEICSAVEAEFYQKLFDDATARPHLQRLLREPQFLALEPVLSTRFPPDQFVLLRADFFRALAEVEAGTTLATLRRIKDDILEACPDESKFWVQSAWIDIMSLLEAGEELIGLEIFFDKLTDSPVPIAPEIEAQLQKLLAQLRGAHPDDGQ